MKKIIFILGVCFCFTSVFSGTAYSACEVNSSADSKTATTLRYLLEVTNVTQSSHNDCHETTNIDGVGRQITFKSSVTEIEIVYPDSSGPDQIKLNLEKNFLIGNSSGGMLVIDGSKISGKAPFDCVSGSKKAHLQNMIVVTNGITDIFSAESCLVQTNSVYVCNGTVEKTDVTQEGWCNGETWPAAEEDDDDDDDDDTGPTIDPSNIQIGPMTLLMCKDEDGDGYYKVAMFSIFNQSSVSRVPCDSVTRGDCDDASATTYPSAEELDDDIDNNCDGQIDEGLCAPSDEVCDGLDNDCDGTVDEDSVCNICTDYDEDGYPIESELCSATEYDCVDNNAEISPAATDICGDGIDQNCSGSDCSVEVCGDGLDNDENGLSDCSDSSCVTYSSCNNLPSEVICNNGLDDEGDGYADCLDADCAQLGVCTGEPETVCGDGLDNDGDGIIDCEDTDCYNVVFNPETGEACPSGSTGEEETGSSSSGCGCYLGTTSGPVGGNFSLLACLLTIVGFIRRWLSVNG